MKSWIIVIFVFASGCAQTAMSAPFFWSSNVGGNDHYYEFRSDVTNWHQAFAFAESSQHLGLPGYLITITSEAENDFILANVTNHFAYAGGSDSAAEGLWEWVSGPEIGEVFWQDGVGSLAYSNWFAGEPNNGNGI
jgi:hypothetical protein